jgi:hypothetical protein
LRTLHPSKLFFKTDFMNHFIDQRIENFEKNLKGVISIALLSCGTAVLDVPMPDQVVGIRTGISREVTPVAETEKKPALDCQESSIRMGSDRSLCRALRQSGVRQDVVNAIARCLSAKLVRRFRPNQIIKMVFESEVLSSIKVYTGVGSAFLIQRHGTSDWSSKRIKIPVVAKYERLKLPITHTLKKSLLSSGLDRALIVDIARSLARSGVVWGNLKGSTVELMIQTRRCEETSALMLDHIAMIQIGKKGVRKTYYAYQRGPHDSRRIFCTLAGFGLQSGGMTRSVPWCPPVSKVKVTSRFGKRLHPVYKCVKHHNGTDYAGAHGSPIRAVGDGVVKSVAHNGSYGKYVTIAHGNGYRTLYAHLSRTMVRMGQRVRKGQTIGGMGSTGTATGTHLHLEVLDRSSRPINPESFLQTRKNQPKIQTPTVSGKQKINFYKQAQSLRQKYAALGGSVATIPRFVHSVPQASNLVVPKKNKIRSRKRVVSIKPVSIKKRSKGVLAVKKSRALARHSRRVKKIISA